MKFKKLRKIYRIVFPKKYSNSELFQNTLKSNVLIENFQKISQLYNLNLKNGYSLFCRDHNHSDYTVFNQMFVLEEYKTVSSILRINIEFNSKESVLIDAGANIGYATIYLQQKINFDKIICIEPSKGNFEILKKNIELLDLENEALFLNRALADKEGVRFNISNDFRDGKDWSFTTKESDSGEIQGITLNEIVKKNNLQEITLLKIDIEGAERFIFQNSTDLSFLKITKVIVLEIHDEFNIRENIYQILKNNNFMLIESGESTIGVNKKYFN